jgi:hypothetical protein
LTKTTLIGTRGTDRIKIRNGEKKGEERLANVEVRMCKDSLLRGGARRGARGRAGHNLQCVARIKFLGRGHSDVIDKVE